MKRLLFLDFDGVLHAEGDPLFHRLPRLEQYLQQASDMEIVISSTWREQHSVDKLRCLFQPGIRERIVGVTPVLNGGYETGGRQREIEAYLKAAECHLVTWVALDDIDWLFDHRCPHLILVDPRRGFGDREGRLLLAWYEAARGR